MRQGRCRGFLSGPGELETTASLRCRAPGGGGQPEVSLNPGAGGLDIRA